MNNHIIDPTFFYQAIEEFSFDYDIYILKEKTVDLAGNEVSTFLKTTIRGSFQHNDNNFRISKEGNTNEQTYNFYCKSLYRIQIGDFIFYKNQFAHVDRIRDLDEWGVRQCSLTMVQLTKYRDFYEWLKYQEGEILV